MSSPADDAEGPLSFDEWCQRDESFRDRTNGPTPSATDWKQALDDLANPGLRIQVGSTVPLSYARQHARRLFVSTLHRLLPNLTDTLVSADGITLQNQADAARAAMNAFVEALPQTDSDAQTRPHPVETLRSLIQDRAEASESLAKHIEGWQKRCHLTDEWVGRAANDTLFIAAYFETNGIELDAPLPLIVVDPYTTLHEGRVRSLADIPDILSAMVSSRHEFTVAPVYIDDLKWSYLQSEDTEQDIGDFLAGFDPRTESVKAGVKRILPALKGRLRRALENIALEDRLVNGAETISPFRTANAFEWLVQYQVFEKDYPCIAEKVDREPSQIGRAVNDAAALMGMTLRQPNKGGRPSRNAPNTKKPVR